MSKSVLELEDWLKSAEFGASHRFSCLFGAFSSIVIRFFAAFTHFIFSSFSFSSLNFYFRRIEFDFHMRTKRVLLPEAASAHSIAPINKSKRISTKTREMEEVGRLIVQSGTEKHGERILRERE